MKQFFFFRFFYVAVLAFPISAAAQSLAWKFIWGNTADSEIGRDVAIDEQGRVLVAGTTNYDPNEGSASRGFVFRLTSSGQLDPTFGNDGVAYIDFPNSSDEVNAIALNSAGDILLAGGSYSSTTSYQGCVFKLKGTDGSLVTTFGSGGRAILPEAAEFNDLLVQPDQKIAVVGWGIVVLAQDADYIVARFTTSGQNDPTFSVNGWVNIEFEDDDLGQSIARQSDGKLVVSGYNWTCGTTSCDDFSVARLLPDGQLDPDYGNGGGNLYKMSPQTGRASTRNMALQNVNNEERALISGDHTSDYDNFLFRLRYNGNPDASFPSGGFREYPTIGGLWGPIAIQGDNKILMGGSASTGIDIMRTTINGAPDGSFGGPNGIFTPNLGGSATSEKIISVGNSIYVVGEIATDAVVVKINNTNVVSTASPDAAAIGMTLYPNPSAGDLNVRFTANESGTAQLRIFNLTGQLAYEMPVELLPGKEQDISLALAGQLTSGNYIFQLQTQHLLASKKLVIEQ